jgi:hypothetical protein
LTSKKEFIFNLNYCVILSYQLLLLYLLCLLWRCLIQQDVSCIEKFMSNLKSRYINWTSRTRRFTHEIFLFPTSNLCDVILTRNESIEANWFFFTNKKKLNKTTKNVLLIWFRVFVSLSSFYKWIVRRLKFFFFFTTYALFYKKIYTHFNNIFMEFSMPKNNIKTTSKVFFFFILFLQWQNNTREAHTSLLLHDY